MFFTMASSTFAQNEIPVDAGLEGEITLTSHSSANTGRLTLRVVNTFNTNAQLFQNIVLNADTVLGRQQLFTLVGSGLGIPVVMLESEFANLGLSIDTFLTARILAHAANVPVQFVVERMNLGQNLGQLAVQLGAPLRLANLRFVSFVRAFSTAIGSANGTVVIDDGLQNIVLSDLERILLALERRCNVLEARLGQDVFERLFFSRLAFETGISFDSLINLRTRLSQFTLARLGASVLLANSINNPLDSVEGAIQFVLQHNDMAILSPFGIIGKFNGEMVPAQLFTQRLAIFTRVLTTQPAV